MSTNIKNILISGLTAFIVSLMSKSESNKELDRLSISNNSMLRIKYPKSDFFVDIYKDNNIFTINGNQDTSLKIVINHVSSKYPFLLPLTDYTSSTVNTVAYYYDSNNDSIIYYSSVGWSSIVFLSRNALPLQDIAISDISFM